MLINEAKEILKQRGFIVEAKKYPQMNPAIEETLREMLMDFWPYYIGAVDIGKSGLSSNPKAQRRHDKMWELLEPVYGEDCYYVLQGFCVWLQDVANDFYKEYLKEHPDFNKGIPEHSGLAIYKKAKVTYQQVVDFIKTLDLNKKAVDFIKKWE